MDQVYHLVLGDSRRLALPAALCRKHDLKPGDHLLLTEGPDGLTLCSLRQQAERVRQELRQMIGKGPPLTKTLKELRRQEAAREAGPR
jgi:bifunctional DNA-binding transcriptional regulator/antitoxin component of YhaV-PrlF toxin-antitoxin module